MPGTEAKYERIKKYLKGMLSNRERHDLEKEMMQDAFEEEAFEGLTRISGDEFGTDMERLRQRLKGHTEPERKRSTGLFYRMAAGILLLAGIAGILYLVFRVPSQSLITEETGKTVQQVPSAAMIPSKHDTLLTAKAESEENGRTLQSPPVMTEQAVQPGKESEVTGILENTTETGTVIMSETGTEAVAETMAAKAVADKDIAERERADKEYAKPAVSRRRSEAAAPAAAGKAMKVLPAAKVVDMEGNPLPGVSVIEKGSTRGTVTDIDGVFSLHAFDSGSVLLLSYIGYAPVEMSAKDIAGKEISMTEDLMALEEVVVVGYGVQKKSELTGAVSEIRVEEISPQGTAGYSSFVNPVPPGGSVKAFKQWVNERLDVSVINAYTGKQKILVSITVQADGSVGDIRIRESVPDSLDREFRRVISQSPRWTPAMKDELPVVAKVALRFAVGKE